MNEKELPKGPIPKPFSLAGERALITGGGSGIGFGIASCFVESGAQVILTGRNEEKLVGAAAKLGPAATWEIHDVTQFDRGPRLIERIQKEHGSISILVNNAGHHLKKTAVDTTLEEFDKVLQTHLVGAFSLTRLVLPEMIERKRGNILFVASMASLFGIPLVSAYSAAKSAYLGLVRSLAVEVSEHGIRVNAVAPGWIKTEMAARILSADPARGQKVLARTPMNRYGLVEEVGWAVSFLCSPAASFVTGVVLPVDGGASIGF